MKKLLLCWLLIGLLQVPQAKMMEKEEALYGVAPLSFPHQKLDYQLHNPPKAVVLPHHLVALDMLTGFYDALSKYSYEEILIISPDHRLKKTGRPLWGKGPWLTSNGLLAGPTFDLVAADRAEELISKEHGITLHLELIRKYFPKASVNGLVINKEIGKEDLLTMAKALEDFEGLLVFSIDFSHYLPAEESNQHDEETLQLLKERSTNLLLLGQDHVDSPGSLFIFAHLPGELIMIDHKNQQDYVKEFLHQTTGYYILVKEQ